MSRVDLNPAMVIGVNYIPRSVVNPYEMWSFDGFNPEVIHEEILWASACRLNSLRVFLNHWAWEEDPLGFLDRFEAFLSICDAHNIKVMPVLFDAVWNPCTVRGAQPDPVPGVHNSRWVQTPTGGDLAKRSRHSCITEYYQHILHHFADDRRILAWDLYNEPDNMNSGKFSSHEALNKGDLVYGLLEQCFSHSKSMGFNKPVTASLYKGDWSGGDATRSIDKLILRCSEIISFHNYHPLQRFSGKLSSLYQYGKPLLCTEYMARTEGSQLLTHLPYMQEKGVGAFSWGLAAGKTQTQYPWDSWIEPCGEEPTVYFHDLLRSDGAPFDPDEISCIHSLNP